MEQRDDTLLTPTVDSFSVRVDCYLDITEELLLLLSGSSPLLNDIYASSSPLFLFLLCKVLFLYKVSKYFS